MSKSSTLVDLLQARASSNGDKLAFRFVCDSDGEVSVTYRELHERAMAIGGELQSLAGKGDRVLLLYPPGLDFVTAFFGCLYAGVVAVPAAPPARNRSTSSVEAIFEAADPTFVLSTAAYRKVAEQSYSHLSLLFRRPWIATDAIEDSRREAWQDPAAEPDHTAFLQYTSGSTSTPKGVVVRHENLLHNAELIKQAFGNRSEGVGVFWLPLYHDMGLIGGVVQPAFCGGSCTLLAPAAFLQRPALWLETITRTGATVSGGPDFAYDLCVRKISPTEREGLDLSRWQVAFTGAERVRAETIERFTEAFAPCGFRREAFFPCYGLAEATLMVSGGPRQTSPRIVHVSAEALALHQVREVSKGNGTTRTLVGCGQCLPGHDVRIVEPEAKLARPDGAVGEIWVRGPSVTGQYYQRPDATEAVFGGYLAQSGEGPFLRTGDLGFLRRGELFVTGRLKDVIIIRGRNHYPEDIERSVERAHPAFRAGYCAAFSIEIDDRDQLVVVQEIEPRHRDLDVEAAVRTVRSAIAVHHELEVYGIVLVKAGSVPKTSSGKTRRSACRERYSRGELAIIAEWQISDEPAGAEAAEAPAALRDEPLTSAEIEAWLIQRIGARLRLPVGQIWVTTPFLEFGMGSVDAVEIAAELERWLGRRISPTAIYNYPNIAALAHWLASPPAESPPEEIHQVTGTLANSDPTRLLEDVRQMTDAEMQAFILEEMAKQ